MGHRATGDAKRRRLSRRSSSGKQPVDHAALTDQSRVADQEFRPMPTGCSASQLHFEGFEGRQVVGGFDGGAVTSNGGAVLMRQP